MRFRGLGFPFSFGFKVSGLGFPVEGFRFRVYRKETRLWAIQIYGVYGYVGSRGFG